ncbi:MAG: hypothetical protein NT027_02660 [Proteobacteria bacterium]|nr:hypothetical protein [Pseudomonadota bacterium]
MAARPKREPKGKSESGIETTILSQEILPNNDSEVGELQSESVTDNMDSYGNFDSVAQAPIVLSMGQSLLRKLTEYAREEGVSREELAAELVSEGLVLRAWEIVERKATLRGNAGNSQSQNFGRNGNNQGQNQGNNAAGHAQSHQQKYQQGGNKMAQRKLQRQARQHANSMDLMSDKAAFLEYVRNQEKKRR